jgi:hypothetical protein
MSDIKRRKQNRDAQRRFREKQAEKAQLSKQQFERLTSKYEALLAENDALKSQQTARSDSSLSVAEDPLKELLSPVDVEWRFEPLPPSHVATFADELDGELFSMEAHDIRLHTPWVDDVAQDSVLAPSMESAAVSLGELQDTIVPTIEHAPTYALEPAAAKRQDFPYPYPDVETSSTLMSNALTFASPPSGAGYSACSTALFASPPPVFGAGPPDPSVHCIPNMSFVQAMLQAALAQERIALIDLERAKLRVCEC